MSTHSRQSPEVIQPPSPSSPSRRRLGRRGQALAEFAIVVPVLMILILGVFEFSRHFYTRLSARHAVAEAARFGATGQQLADPETGDPMSRAESMVFMIQRGASNLRLEVKEIDLDPSDGGGPGDVVRVRARYAFAFGSSRLIQSFAPPILEFVVTTTVRNEPVF